MWLIINCVISCYRIRFKVTLFKYIFGPPLLLYSTAHTDCEGCVGMRLYIGLNMITALNKAIQCFIAKYFFFIYIGIGTEMGGWWVGGRGV